MVLYLIYGLVRAEFSRHPDLEPAYFGSKSNKAIWLQSKRPAARSLLEEGIAFKQELSGLSLFMAF